MVMLLSNTSVVPGDMWQNVGGLASAAKVGSQSSISEYDLLISRRKELYR
jgi:hypothetical protein